MLAEVSHRHPTELRKLIRRHLPMLLDPSISLDQLTTVFKESLQSFQPRTPRIEAPFPQPPAIATSPLKLPLKYRNKGSQPTESRSSHVVSIPILPRYESAGLSQTRNQYLDPEIGSLVAAIHPALGRAYVCRAIAKRMVNDVHTYYLVVFFQPECSPCYISSEYVFHFKGEYGFPLGEDAKFRQNISTLPISVDWLLEQIFSSAQKLVMEYHEILSMSLNHSLIAVERAEDHVQQILFQCVSYAAMIITCSVCSEWKLPDAKVKIILETVMKSNQAKFVTTAAILPKVEQILTILSSR
jgi:hypothetical protein